MEGFCSSFLGDFYSPSSSFCIETHRKKRLITESELAEILTCSVRHLQNLRRWKLIPYVRLGPRLVRYDPSEVERAIQKLTIREHGRG
jgi:predicted DNA-binding transcriptional regulator AlpA